MKNLRSERLCRRLQIILLNLSCMQSCWRGLPRCLASFTPCRPHILRSVRRHFPVPAAFSSGNLPTAGSLTLSGRRPEAHISRIGQICRASSAQADSPAGAFTTATLRAEVNCCCLYKLAPFGVHGLNQLHDRRLQISELSREVKEALQVSANQQRKTACLYLAQK